MGVLKFRVELPALPLSQVESENHEEKNWMSWNIGSICLTRCFAIAKMAAGSRKGGFFAQLIPSGVLPHQRLLMPARFHNLADAADYLNEAPGFMKSFGDFSGKTTPWFYSFNSHLAGGAGRPKQFTSWDHWHHFTMNQKLYLCAQAGLKSNAIAENGETLDQLREQWANWPNGYYVVNWATTAAHGSTCNIFLGECLTLCGYENQAQHAGKYLSAQSYWSNHNRDLVQEVNKRPGNIKRGMIMSYRYDAETYHLEVITSGAVGEETWFGLSEAEEKTTFRSRGGGRGAGGDGEERQGRKERTLSNSLLKVFKLNH